MTSATTVVLAVETATSICSVAILDGDNPAVEISLKTPRRHNEVLPGIVNQILSETGKTPQDIDVAAVSIGPGSFTGLRVGLSFVKGFAQGSNASVVPVGTLDGMAIRINDFLKNVHQSNPSRICPLTIARRGEVFGRFYLVQDDVVEPIDDPFIGNSQRLSELINSKCFIAGEGADALEGELLEHLAGRLVTISDETKNLLVSEKDVLYIPELGASAVTIGYIGKKTWLTSREAILSIHDIEPFYMKEFTVKKPKII